MRNSAIGKWKRMKHIAAVLILSLVLSELPVMQVGATVSEGTEQESTVLTEVPVDGEDETEITKPDGEEDPETDGENGEDDGTETGGETGEGDDPETDDESGEGDDPETDGESGEEDPEIDGEIEEDSLETDDETAGDVAGTEEETDLLTEEEIAAQRAMRPEHMPELEVFELPEYYEAVSTYSILPEKYDSREDGILSEIRNQNPWGTCWAFATLGAMEASLVKNGIVESGQVDLSEGHLANFTYNTGYDRLGYANGDTITITTTTTPAVNPLNIGGNAARAAMRLMNWQGAAAEDSYPYSKASETLDREKAQDDIYHMRDCYLLKTESNDEATIQNVKTLIREFGCVEWSYFDDDDYHNYSKNQAYYSNVYSTTNHAIMVVGWDDTYPRENFGNESTGNQRPQKDGAWIVRNSWGKNWGDNGYFYISYEDTSLGSGNPAAVITAEDADNYDNNYFNSNTINGAYGYYYGKVAQVFQVKGLDTDQEELKAVSFMVGNTNTEYQIQIYKNPQLYNGVVVNPESGTKMLDEPLSGIITYAGIYTVDLDQPVTFEIGDYMAVVIRFPEGNGIMYCDGSYESSISAVSWYNETVPGESFCSWNTYGYNWTDLSENGASLRINLLTNNVNSSADQEIEGSATVVCPANFIDPYNVNLRWNKLRNISGYEIYRADSAEGNYTYVGKTDASVRQFKDNITRQQNYGKKYYYKIKGIFTDGSSTESEPVEALLEEVIEFCGFKLFFNGETAELSWDKVAGAAGYEIERKEEKGAVWESIGRVGADSTVYSDDLSEKALGNYQYRVRAYSADDRYTEWSQEETAVMQFKIAQVSYNTLKFTLPPKDDSCRYIIWIKVGNSYQGHYSYTQTVNINIENWIKSIQKQMPDIPDFHVGNKYLYVVEIRNSSNMTVFPSPYERYYQTVPDAMTIQSLEFTDSGAVELTWSGGAGADAVEIYRSENPEDCGEVYQTIQIGENSFTDSNITKEKTYYYWVRPIARNSSGETVKGEISPHKDILIPFLLRNTVLESVKALSDTEVELSWEENTEADGYYIYRSDSENGSNTQLAEIKERTQTVYKDTTAETGNIYYYSIAAYAERNGKKETGKVSERVAVRTLPARGEITDLTYANAGVKVQWNAVVGADGYLLERCAPGADFEQLAELENGNTTEYTDAKISNGNTYIYRVTAYNAALDGNRQNGAVSEEKSISIPLDGISISTVSAVNEHTLNIRWNAVEGASYEVYRSDSVSGEYTLLEGEEPIREGLFEDHKVVTGKTYYYKVVIDINGLKSLLSDTVAKSGRTKPDKPVLEEAGYDKIVIQSNPDFEYAIRTAAGSTAERRFVEGTGDLLSFEGLAENSRYYIIARTRSDITEENPVYGAELEVKTNVKAQLVLSPSSVVISKGNRVSFNATITPENIHYEGLKWTATDWSGNALDVESVGNTSIVRDKSKENGGMEILRIVDGRIYAVGDSEQKEVYLKAARGTMTAAMKVRINVPVVSMSIQARETNGENVVSLDALQIGDSAVLDIEYDPDNADDIGSVNWSVSNSRVAAVDESDPANVLLTAKGAGECVLKAVTADGISVERKICVSKRQTVYGIWLSDTEPADLGVVKDEEGGFRANGLQEKPVRTLRADTGDETDASIVLDAYLLTDETADSLRKAEVGEVVYRSANTAVATVDSQGKVTAAGEGSTDIFAFAPTGGGVFGSCRIEVVGNREIQGGECSIDKSRKLSAVTSAFQIQKFGNDSLSSCSLQVKDQTGAVLDPKLFTYTSADSSVCIVDEDGVVTPNPEYAGTKNKKVTITAFLKDDPAKRKVAFTVTVLAANQVEWICLERVNESGESETAQTGESVFRQWFEKGASMTFVAKAYDSNQNQMDKPSLGYGVSDSSVASVKVNKDGTVTLTLKKPGRVNLICTAKDNYKQKASVQIVSVTSAPIISTKQVTLNKMLAETDDNLCVSENFQVIPPAEAVMTVPEIVSVKVGKKELTEETGLDNFKIAENEDGSYGIALDNAGGFVDGIKNNTVYTVDMKTQVTGIPELEGEATENFSIKVKVVSSEPKLSVTVPSINRNYVLEEDVTGLLVIKAADVVTDVHVLEGAEQINSFDQYFEVEPQKNGQWYLKFKDETGKYTKSSLKGKIAFTVNGYKTVVRTVTVKTPLTKQKIAQQSVPSIHDSVSGKAEIVLYNSTQKKVLEDYRIFDVESNTLDLARENDGTLQATIINGVSYKNGATLTAKLKVMETKNGEDCWKEPVSLKVSVKVFTSINPTITMKASTLTLNSNTPKGTDETKLTLNQQNVRFKDKSEWELYAYNSTTKKYDLQGDSVDWIAFDYNEKEQMFSVGYAGSDSGEPDSSRIKAGSYKFRVSGLVEGFDSLYKDFTVKVIDTKPTVSIKMSGKLDLVNRAKATLSGKITVKNSKSPVSSVAILNGDGTENTLYRVSEVSGSAFRLVLTDEGLKAPLTTQKQTLPIKITLENGYSIESNISFKPVQTTPKITVPAAQTIYKSAGNLTRDYDMMKNQTEGTVIKRIDIVNIPNGLGVIAKEGHVLVTLGDRGLKAGSYTIKMNIYFEGEESIKGNPNGKPLSKTITVKIAE